MMRFNDLVTVSAATWQTNRLRIILTLLVIAIGIAALIAAFSIMAGANETVNKIMAGFNGKFMMVYPSRDPVLQRVEVKNFNMDDARAIAGVSGITLISLQKSARWIPVKFLDRQLQTDINGTDPNFAIIRNRTVEKGRFIDTSDLLNERRVCVITEGIRKQFFPAGDYLEQRLEINGILFEIVGCLRPVLLPATFSLTNGEEGTVFIPLTTCQSLFNQYDCDQIWFSYAKAYEAKEATKLLKGTIISILKYRHGETEVFTLKTIDEIMEQPKNMAFTVMVALCSVTVLCLLVGGTGIREVIRARNHAISGQFLMESVILSAVGGSPGLLLGIIAGRLVSVFVGMPTSLTWWGLLSGIGCMILAGIVTGFFATEKAVKLNRPSVCK